MPGGLSVGVPGNVRLMAMAHRKWGKLPWADLFQPAIHLAEGGFEVNELLHGRLERMAALWKEFPKAQALYWREGGPAPVGAIIKHSELASFLQELAAEGHAAFYPGDNPDMIVAALASAPRNPAYMPANGTAPCRERDWQSVKTSVV